jgi:hypothetical protein
MRADRPTPMHADGGRVPPPGLARPTLHVQELTPAQGLAVPAAEPVRVEPLTDRVLADDRVFELRCKRTQLSEERLSIRACKVTSARHA